MYSPAMSSPRDGVSRPSSKSEARNETSPRREFAVMWPSTMRISGVICAPTVVQNAANSTAMRSLVIVEFFQPCHLYRFQLRLVGFLGIVFESVELRDPFM